MKIAIIDHVGIKAGMNYYDSSLMKAISNKDCSTYVYSNYNSVLINDKTKYYSVFDSHTKKSNRIKFYNFIKGSWNASKRCRAKNIDLIIVHLFSANYLSFLLFAIVKLFNSNIAVIAHDVSSFVDGDNEYFQNLIYNRIANRVIVHNQFSYEKLIKHVKIKDRNKIMIVKHGGYLDHIKLNCSKEEARGTLNLDPNVHYILFFGQIKKVKGLDILLNSLTYLDKNIHLIIAGKPWKDDFQYYDEIIEHTKTQNRIEKHIRFIEDSERELFFYASDLIVLPYRIIFQSGVLLMAMSYGLPVIASDLPSNREIIKPGYNGYLFKSENTKDLADKINKFYKQNPKQIEIKKNAVETIKTDYSWSNIAEKYLKFL